MGVPSFVHTSEVRAEHGSAVVDEVVDSWMDGKSTFFVLITTRPVSGWNNVLLYESDWLGAWGLCGASQDGTRVGRDGSTVSNARFYLWPEWSKNFTDEEHRIFVIDVASYELLFEDQCLRRVLALTTELAPTGLPEDLDATNDDNERVLRDCAWFAASATCLSAGTQVAPCSFCYKAPRRTGIDSPHRSPLPARGRSRTGARSLTDASCQIAIANLKYSNHLGANLLCSFCGSNCGSISDGVRPFCLRAFGVLKGRCSRCFSSTHTSVDCPNVKPSEGCKEICTKCFNIACLDWQHDATHEEYKKYKTQCVNPEGNDKWFGLLLLVHPIDLTLQQRR